MITLLALGIIAFIAILIAVGLIILVGTVVTGVVAICLDIAIGLSPFLLIWWLLKRRGEYERQTET